MLAPITNLFLKSRYRRYILLFFFAFVLAFSFASPVLSLDCSQYVATTCDPLYTDSQGEYWAIIAIQYIHDFEPVIYSVYPSIWGIVLVRKVFF